MKRFERDELQARKAERRSERRAERAKVYEVHDLGNVPFPDDVNVRPLTPEEIERCYGPGYLGASGQLTSLLVGQELEDVVHAEENRTFFFRKNRIDLLLRDLEVDTSGTPISDREEGFKGKVGPFYCRHYKTWAAKAFASFSDNTKGCDFTTPALQRAIAKVVASYAAVNTGGRLAIPSSLKGDVNKEASTGYPFFISEWEETVNYMGLEVVPIDWAFELADACFADRDYSAFKGMFYNMFTRLNYRGMDPSKQKSNERPVQCSPILERALGLPLQQHMVVIQKSADFSRGLCGKDEMSKFITEAMNEFSGCFEADYSAFDTSISPTALAIVRDVIKTTLCEDDHHLVDGLFDFYLTAELLTPTGLLSGTPSLMSGSMLTNVIGMVWGNIAWEYFVERLLEEGVNLRHRAFGYSDDLAIFYDTNSCPNPDEMFPRIVGELGLVAHKDKQFLSIGDERTIGFLGHIYSNTIRVEDMVVPVYPYYRGLSKVIWRERVSRELWDFDCIYDASGLTKLEQEAAKVLQRIDNYSTHPKFSLIASAIIKASGVNSNICKNFRADTKAFRALDEYEDAHGPSSEMELPSPTEPVNEDEMRMALELYRECLAYGGEPARRGTLLVRDVIKDLRKIKKERDKLERKAQKAEVKKEKKKALVPQYPQCQLTDRPLNYADIEYGEDGEPLPRVNASKIAKPLTDEEEINFLQLMPLSPKAIRALIEQLQDVIEEAQGVGYPRPEVVDEQAL